MELDQLIFKKILAIFGKRSVSLSQDEKERKVELEDIRGQLVFLARALTGAPLDIMTAEREGGLKGKYIFLPQHFYFLKNRDLNLKYYHFKTFYLATAYLLLKSNKLTPEAVTNTIILDKLYEDFPILKTLHRQLKDGLEEYFTHKKEDIDVSWLYGTIRNDNDDEDINKSDLDDKLDENALPSPDTVVKAKPVEDIQSVSIDKKKQEDWVFTHNFEKVETIEEYTGLPRDFDGSDTLDDDAEAMAEAGVKHTIRIDEETHSIWQAEFVSNATIPDSKDAVPVEKHYLYDEYNIKTKNYRKDYCKVFHKYIEDENIAYYHDTLQHNSVLLRSIRKQFANFFNKMSEIKRVENGDTLNIDALTDMVSDIYAGHTPDEKIYNTKRKNLKDISILFLLDQSLSSDGYAAGNRIIDIEKQIAILMGEVLNDYDIEFEIDSFSSKTRNNCRYYTVKSFDLPWNKGKIRVPAITPAGYTRMGPALRHATYLLDQREALTKWIVFLTDGKPNDYDKYEGKYGIADVKQALREMEVKHISIHAFAIEKKAKYYLPLMFGTRNYNVLSNPAEMIIAMTRFIERIINK